MSIDTLSEVKLRLGISTTADDALLTRLQSSAESWLEVYCNRSFATGPFTEYHDGGSSFVHLRNYPVAEVTSVKVDPQRIFGPGTQLPLSAYCVHRKRGVVQSTQGRFVPPPRSHGLVSDDPILWDRAPGTVEVIYTTVHSQAPAAVQQAYTLLIGYWYQWIKTMLDANYRRLETQRFGDTSTSWSNFYLDRAGIPPGVVDLLKPFREPSL